MNTKEYKVVNEISFDKTTPDKVCQILSRHCGGRNTRVRIFLGDAKTGKDWLEVCDTIGYIGRSTGNVKIPLMIRRKDSLGGGAILDHCIVKITIDKQVVYQHPNYHCPIEKRGAEIWDTEKNCCVFRRTDGNLSAVEREFQFFLCNRNSH
jgi:hypothetical protein